VRYGDMVTLGGDCNKNNCGKMWSAARPAENAFANSHYWKFMTDHGFPTNPPAKACGAI
jgi:phage gp16-like protein